MLVECVPNFSEGRDADVIDALAAAADSTPGAALLDVHSDPDHHRTVLTIAGQAQAVCDAVFAAAKVAVERIDMTKHSGVHPRIGAVDVVPFVPLGTTTREDCVALARRFAARLANDLGLPCYLYADSAPTHQPERRRLAWIRKPEFEGLGEALNSPERAPDVGPSRPHPTAGATSVGARGFLVAFNMDLDTDQVAIARRVAKAVRESSGGLFGVQAKGLALPEQQRVQVSMNLLDVHANHPGVVFREVERLAAEAGVKVAGSELVGLMPRAAAVAASSELLALRGAPLAERVLESRMDLALADPAGPLPRFAERVASPGHLDPGGGSAAALSLVLGRACLVKAIELSRGGKGKLEEQELDQLVARLPGQRTLVDEARDDHQAFAELMLAWKLPKGSQRKAALREARVRAVHVPEQLLEAAVVIAEAAAEVAERGNPNLVNDAVAAAEFALAAGRVARLNARANQKKKERRGYSTLLGRLEDAAARARSRA